MQIGDVTISAALTWFLGACVAVAAIAKAVEIIKGLFGRGKINSDIKRHEEALTNISAAVEKLKKAQSVQCKGMLSLINHQLSGNDVDKLRDARDELLGFLAEG